jgi:hypothetical protein
VLLRSRIRVPALAAASVLVLAGCGGSDSSSSSTTTQGGSAASAAPGDATMGGMAGMPGSSTGIMPSATATPAGTVVHIDLVNGKPKARPVAILKAKQGSTITIIATADKDYTGTTPYEIHVHGFDYKLELTPGQTVTKTFTADQPKGSYEVEVENTSYLLFHLEID